MIVQFGSGVVFAKPVAGNEPTDPTPYRVPILQDVTVDFKGELKKLWGQYQVALAVARGKVNVDIKGKFAAFDPNMLNQLYFAQNAVPGYDVIVDGEEHTVTGNVVTATHTPLTDDWGVTNEATGEQYMNVGNVDSITGGAQYALNTTSGLYTFDNSEDTAVLKVSYTYNQNTTGTTIQITNELMGYAPELAFLLYNTFRGKYLALRLNSVTLGGVTLPTKLDDFWISDFDGTATADVSNNVGKLMADNF